jgi:regulatory protein
MKETRTIPENIAIDRLMQLCSRAEKSSYDIRKKLKEWGLVSKADQIIKQLTFEKYIDDGRYAKAYAHDKILMNKWGKIKVKYSLKCMQISDEDIDFAFDQIDDEAYSNMVFTELLKKKNTLKKVTLFQLKSKLFSFGTQRGYEPELIHRFTESN